MADNPHRALIVFDLDGTLLRGPTVCEVLAQSLGRLPRMQEIERLKDRLQIAAAREEMAGWYRNVAPAALIASLRTVELAPGLATGISLLRAHGFAIGIASITWRFAAEHFAGEWGVEHCLATTLQASGAIDHVWPEDKALWARDLSARLSIPLERTVAVGDSGGDYEMLRAVGTSIFVGSESPPVQQDWLHWPAANIEHLAHHVIGTVAHLP